MGIATFGGAILRDFTSPEFIATAIVNTISLSGLFQYMVRQSALVESYMTSFERLLTYSQLSHEANAGALEPGSDFPRKGAIKVSGLKMRYREDLVEVLKGMDFECVGGVKVGICGRTGSGKSSLLMALARFTDNTEGTITIDGIDISQLPLHTLRGCIAWVPQEPNFWSGTLRFNLDPVGTYTDNAIWTSLRTVEMADVVGAEGLDMVLADNGSNFSIGERQLFSLARALLQRRKIIFMDEAFANVDFATDKKVQAAIHAICESMQATVLVVAHRMSTLSDSDCLIVMSDGVVAESGSPKELSDAGGLYAEMLGCNLARDSVFDAYTPDLRDSDDGIVSSCSLLTMCNVTS